MSKKSLELTQFAGVINGAMATPRVPDTNMDVSKIYAVVQVRKKFSDLEQFAEILRVDGIKHPLLVHEEKDGRYRIIAGERRFRAALLIGLKTVPVNIERGLDEATIRRLQVSENMTHRALTVHEQALGVVEDTTKYGAEEAAKIWGRSAAWISKRMAVKSYKTVTLSILEEELSGDLEILSVLNQIEELDAEEASRYKIHLIDGKPLPRDEIRNKLALMKKQKEETENYAAEKNAEIDSNIAGSQLHPDAGDEEEVPETVPDVESNNFEASGGSKTMEKPGTQRAADKKPPGRLGVPATSPGKQESKPAKAPKRDLEEERRQAEQELLTLRKEAVEWGDGNGGLVKEMQEKFRALDSKPDDAEFVLWSCFLDSVLPMLFALGPERSKAYIARLQSDSKKKGIEKLYEELHPTQELGGGIRSKIEVPIMPTGWKF
ncbi:ParB/RepB/Spo0J family partition protein [Undibacterium sp. SXout7W]|uniref:ParB/RepB/Spo0J family partition protein n=1 Tax=Undibacterium sp. SXout7W TaxID=3413049 RepID=UPI003BF1572A